MQTSRKACIITLAALPLQGNPFLPVARPHLHQVTLPGGEFRSLLTFQPDEDRRRKR